MSNIRINTDRYKVLVNTQVNYDSNVWEYKWPLAHSTVAKHLNGNYRQREKSDQYEIGVYDIDNIHEAHNAIRNFLDWWGRGIRDVASREKLTDLVVYAPGYVESTYKCATSFDLIGSRIKRLCEKGNVLDNNKEHHYTIHISLPYTGGLDSIDIKIAIIPDDKLSKSEQALRANRARRKMLEKSRKHMAKKLVSKDAEISKLRSEIKALKDEHSRNK